MAYSNLDPEKIIGTAAIIEQRIGERFPGSGLRKLAAELTNLSKALSTDAKALSKPILWLRVLLGMVTFVGALVFVFVGTFLSFDRVGESAFDFVQGVEASINTLVLAGLGFLTLYKWEERIKRRKAHKGLHALRSIIHIIDMHQLTKDPIVFKKDFKPTASSPQRVLSASDLSRYLDYCSEMLAITGKLAALYAQAVPDGEIVDAVNDVESLGSNLSRKMWQKIMILEGTTGKR